MPELAAVVVVVVRRVVLAVVVDSVAEEVVEVLLEVVVDRLAEEVLEVVVGSGVHLVEVASHREVDEEASHREDVAGEVTPQVYHKLMYIFNHSCIAIRRPPSSAFEGSLSRGSGQSY